MLRSVAAVIIGYVCMVGGTWFAQEAMFPGVDYGKSPWGALLLMGFFTSAGGGLGGMVTAMLAPRRPYLHLIPMAVLIAVETTVLYVQGRVHGPLWFEVMAGGSLIAGTYVAAWVWLRVKPWLSGKKDAVAA